jgi:hypothetical protein
MSRFNKPCFALLALLLWNLSALAQQQTTNACALAAYKEYVQMKLALLQPQLQDVTRLMSYQAIIAGRRLQEQYCLRFAQCLFDINTSTGAAMFSSCLQDEVLDEYDAEPRK